MNERGAERAPDGVEALRAGREVYLEISSRRLRLTGIGSRLWLGGLRLLIEARDFSLGLRDLHTRRQPAHRAGEKRHTAAGEQLLIGERP